MSSRQEYLKRVRGAAFKRAFGVYILRQDGFTYREIGEIFEFSTERARQMVRYYERRQREAKREVTGV